jgi:hypothetical protein
MNQPSAELVDLPAGTHIRQAAEILCRAAVANGYAAMRFNGIHITATSGDTPAKVVADWVAQNEAAAKAYRESPEAIAAEAAAQQERRDLQAKADALTERLPALDWSDDVAILDWCCEFQESSDRHNVLIKRETILAEFAKHGFVPNMCSGPDYIDGNRKVMHAYLIGQALDGMKHLAIHPMIHDFAGTWKRRFVTEVSGA